jgi:hypothetical protein
MLLRCPIVSRRRRPAWIATCALVASGCGTSSSHTDSTLEGGPVSNPPTTTSPVDQDASLPVDSSVPIVPDDAGAAPADGSSPIQDSSIGAGDDGGLAIGDGGVTPYKGVANSACADLMRLGVTWFYNWELSPSNCATSQFVPMIWGHTGSEQTAAGVASEISGLKGAGYRIVLGFNEPDNSSQSNLSVTTAISLWPSFTSDATIRVGSPATQANSSGQTWFTDFMKQVNADTTGRLRVDFIAAHWYGWNTGSCDDKAAGLESYIEWLEAIPGNRPIWLTEWGCLNQSNPTAMTVQSFFSGAIVMFAKHPRLERYGWYPWTTNNELVAPDGSLTSLGTVFAAAPAHE